MIPDRAELLRRAAQAREQSHYLKGVADALESLAGADGTGKEPETPKPRNQYRSKRQLTMRPVMDILRENPTKRFTMSELIARARENGHDLMRPSVTRAIKIALERGWVKLYRDKIQFAGFGSERAGTDPLNDFDRLIDDVDEGGLLP